MAGMPINLYSAVHDAIVDAMRSATNDAVHQAMRDEVEHG